MTTYLSLVFDAVIVILLLFFFLRGSKKGFFLTLCGILAVFVALFGARFLAQQLSPMVADAMTPHFSAVVEEKVDGELMNKMEQFLTSSEEDGGPLVTILKAVGLYDSFADSVRDLLGKQTITDLSTALARSIAQSVASVLIFIIAFLLILLLWTVLSRLLNLATRLPILHGLNGLLGGLLGLVEGALILFLIAWLLRLFGGVIPQDIVDNSTVLNFFMTTNPISMFAGI